MKKRDEDLINIDVFTPSSKSDEFDSSTSLWEDEDTRQFYECMPDLKSLIPGILYKPSSSTTNTGAAGEAAATATTTEGEAAAKSVVAEEVAATPVDASAEDLKLEMEKMERELQELESQQQAPAAGGSSLADADLPPPPLPDLDEKDAADTTGTTASSVSISAANMKVRDFCFTA